MLRFVSWLTMAALPWIPSVEKGPQLCELQVEAIYFLKLAHVIIQTP
jgi:hypothetical protein